MVIINRGWNAPWRCPMHAYFPKHGLKIFEMLKLNCWYKWFSKAIPAKGKLSSKFIVGWQNAFFTLPEGEAGWLVPFQNSC